MANDQYFHMLSEGTKGFHRSVGDGLHLLNGLTSMISSNSVTTTRAIKIYRSQIKLQFNWTSMKEHWTQGLPYR